MAGDINEPIVESFVSPNVIPQDEEVPEAQRIFPPCGRVDYFK